MNMPIFEQQLKRLEDNFNKSYSEDQQALYWKEFDVELKRLYQDKAEKYGQEMLSYDEWGNQVLRNAVQHLLRHYNAKTLPVLSDFLQYFGDVSVKRFQPFDTNKVHLVAAGIDGQSMEKTYRQACDCDDPDRHGADLVDDPSSRVMTPEQVAHAYDQLKALGLDPLKMPWYLEFLDREARRASQIPEQAASTPPHWQDRDRGDLR